MLRARLPAQTAAAGIEPEVAVVPAGERHKTMTQAFDLMNWLTGTQAPIS